MYDCYLRYFLTNKVYLDFHTIWTTSLLNILSKTNCHYFSHLFRWNVFISYTSPTQDGHNKQGVNIQEIYFHIYFYFHVYFHGFSCGFIPCRQWSEEASKKQVVINTSNFLSDLPVSECQCLLYISVKVLKKHCKVFQ